MAVSTTIPSGPRIAVLSYMINRQPISYGSRRARAEPLCFDDLERIALNKFVFDLVAAGAMPRRVDFADKNLRSLRSRILLVRRVRGLHRVAQTEISIVEFRNDDQKLSVNNFCRDERDEVTEIPASVDNT